MKEGGATLRKGVSTDIVALQDLDRPGTGNMRSTVTGADGTTLLDWSAQRNFELKKEHPGPVPGEAAVLVEYNPASEFLGDRGRCPGPVHLRGLE